MTSTRPVGKSLATRTCATTPALSSERMSISPDQSRPTLLTNCTLAPQRAAHTAKLAADPPGHNCTASGPASASPATGSYRITTSSNKSPRDRMFIEELNVLPRADRLANFSGEGGVVFEQGAVGNQRAPSCHA